MERINMTTLLGDLLFSERKGRNLLKPLAAWCWRFILEIYLCFEMKKRNYLA